MGSYHCFEGGKTIEIIKIGKKDIKRNVIGIKEQTAPDIKCI